MAGRYWRLKDDGAAWRCQDCQCLKKHTDVILIEYVETQEHKLLCVDCVDEEWLAGAKCLGSK